MSRKRNYSNLVDERPSGVKYKFFDKGRITQATLYGVSANLDNVMRRTLEQSRYLTYYPKEVGYFADTLPNEFTAKSKAHPHDIKDGLINTDKGMDIAHERVMNKYHKVFDNKFVDMLSDINMVVARFIHYAEKKGINISKTKSIDTCLKELRQK